MEILRIPKRISRDMLPCARILLESFLGELSGAEVYHAQVAAHQRAAVPSPK